MKLAVATCAAGPPWLGPLSAVPRMVPSASTATTVKPASPLRNQPSRATSPAMSLSQE